jgi:hypothetical protein
MFETSSPQKDQADPLIRKVIGLAMKVHHFGKFR